MLNPTPPISKQFSSGLEQQLFDNAHFGVLVVDKNRHILKVNQTFCRLFGYEADHEIVGQSVSILHRSNENDRIFGEDAFDKVMTNEPISLSYQLAKKDGHPIWVQISGVAALTEKAVIWTIVDITESKQANEKLRESEEKFRIAFQTSPDSINLNRFSDGVYVDINEGFTKIMGYKAYDVIGKSSLELNIWKNHTDREKLVRILQEQGYVENLEAEFITKNREVVHGLLSARIIVVNNEPQILSVTRDISDRKTMEEKLKKREEQLRQKLKMEAIGVMAGGLAHNFNNALAAILGSLEMAKRKIDTPEKIKPYLETARKASIRSRDLVSQLLTYCRREAVTRKPADLVTVTAETLKLLDLTLSPQITLKHNLQRCRNMMIEADPNQVKQALLTLCNNAVQAMGNEGNLLIQLNKTELASTDIPAQFGHCSPGSFFQITISDTGCGMDAETMEKIFDPFFTTKDIGEGTGMGLPMVQGIIDQHGGIVKVHSTVGLGSSFALFFPALKAECSSKETVQDSPRL